MPGEMQVEGRLSWQGKKNVSEFESSLQVVGIIPVGLESGNSKPRSGL